MSGAKPTGKNLGGFAAICKNNYQPRGLGELSGVQDRGKISLETIPLLFLILPMTLLGATTSVLSTLRES